MAEQDLKAQGNEAFKLGKYAEAEGFYKQAIAMAEAAPLAGQQQHVYHSNLAACYFEQGRLKECVVAADRSLELEPSWLKAYYRKVMALEALAKAKKVNEAESNESKPAPNTNECDGGMVSVALPTERVVLSVWEAANQHCEPSPLLKKQLLTARVRWLRQFKRTPVCSSDDLLDRYSLLSDSREKLSTMAHLWNASTKSERLQHFKCFLTMVAGAGGVPDLPVTEEMMVAMPLHNYHDLPRTALEPWCAFFEQQDSEEKTRLFQEIWERLTDQEQTAVIADLRLFLGMQMQDQDLQEEGGKSSGSENFEDGDEGINMNKKNSEKVELS